ncbi:DUF6090 family protein [Croceivirga thetidis]|uniref:Uncharacterized protein n=1 Tax=Croceivirga thetidis TaxID=2721623 RepID=A0ABX1GPR7_9FLAO|nr:DUF6090 family protein [Croceivirga thetidis]NKI30945.1 hypothetical protein [Croceivirga thetidis]
MIKFFRKIRQKLLSENKFSKYLLYAIGEIILVVIGILIALQINTWNEKRKANNDEQRLIADLNTEFQNNYDELKVDIKRLQRVVDASGKLLVLLQEPESQIGVLELDSLISESLTTPTWNPSFFVIEELKKSGGFAQLKNAELKTALLEWERYYTNLLEVEAIFSRSFHYFIDYLTEHGSIRNVDDKNPGFNVGISRLSKGNISLLTDYRFENHIDNIHVTSLDELHKYQMALTKIETILTRSKSQ